jgi:RHS repeat-associated protein
VGPIWTYDRFGNRTNQNVTAGSAPTQSAAVDSATNRMIGYGYDANGNLTSEPVINYSYTYDAENHLVGFSGNGTSSFGYDGNGLRAKKVGTDGTITYSIFSQGRVIAEYLNSNGASAPGREFVYDGQGEYLATISGAGTLDFYHLDHESIRLVTDATGNTAGERGDYPYGEIWYGSGFFTPNNFTSYRQETESNTDYAEFRYYSLRTGKFMQADPVAGSTDNPQSWSRFAYVLDDPINGLDPLGLQSDCTPNDDGTVTCHTPPEVDVNANDDGGGPPIIVIELPPPQPLPLPGDGGGDFGGLPPHPNKPPKKESRVQCAARKADQLSIAGVLGLSDKSGVAAGIAKGFLGNDVSTIVNTFTGEANPAETATFINNEVNGLTEKAVNAATAPEAMTTLGLASESTGAALAEGEGGLTALNISGRLVAEAGEEGLGGPIAFAKLAIDGGIFLGAFISCHR